MNYKNKKKPNFYNAEIKDYLEFIYTNGTEENITDTLDLLFMMMDEIEEEMKMKIVDNIGNLIMFPILNKNLGGDDNRAS